MLHNLIPDLIWYGLIVLPTFVIPVRLCLEWEAWFASGETFRVEP